MFQCRLLRAVRGFENRCNDILYKEGQNPKQGSVVFFPGDVQDLGEEQRLHRDNSRYLAWSLENTTEVLTQAFPNHNIFTIRPSKKTLKTFSCFDNFVASCDGIGSPQHSSDHQALVHLAVLLNSCAQLLEKDENTFIGDLTLVGFSKGVVVLNQLVHELAALACAGKQPGLSLSRFIWLDGGHNGGKGTSITDPDIIRRFAGYGIRVSLRVTPYQVEDTRRPWIKQEEKIFHRLLRDSGVEVHRKLYFEDQESSILNHFNIISTLETDPVAS